MRAARVGPSLGCGIAMSRWIAAITVIAALALVLGGIRLAMGGRRSQGILMIVAALVILLNLAILIVPVSG